MLAPRFVRNAYCLPSLPATRADSCDCELTNNPTGMQDGSRQSPTSSSMRTTQRWRASSRCEFLGPWAAFNHSLVHLTLKKLFLFLVSWISGRAIDLGSEMKYLVHNFRLASRYPATPDAGHCLSVDVLMTVSIMTCSTDTDHPRNYLIFSRRAARIQYSTPPVTVRSI